MQLIKRVGAFLVHSAYISNNSIYTKTKPPHFSRINPDSDTFVSDIFDNIVKTSSNPLNTLDIIDNTVNSANSAFDTSDYNRDNDEQLDGTFNSFQHKDRSNPVDKIVNSLSTTHSTVDTPVVSKTKNDYIDSFDQNYSRRGDSDTKNPHMMSEMRGLEATPDKSVVLGSEEYNNLKEEIAMLKRELYLTKSYIEKPKVKKKVYEPIEVRLSLRIHEDDLRTKCNFFKKKCLKGFPLVFIIRTEGDPKDYTLAAEGIISKAKMFLANACVPAGKMLVTNTHISQHFNPVNKPHSYSTEIPRLKERSRFKDSPDTYSKSDSYSESMNTRTPIYQLDSRSGRPESHSQPTKSVFHREITNSDDYNVKYPRKSRLPGPIVNHPRERSPGTSVNNPVASDRSNSSSETHSRWIVKHKSSTTEPTTDTNSRDAPNTGAEASKWKVLNKSK